MTDAQKLERIKDLLHQYKDNDTVFDQPISETEQQKNFRKDLMAVVSLVFNEDLDIPSHVSRDELRERLQKIWEKAKPDSWR